MYRDCLIRKKSNKLTCYLKQLFFIVGIFVGLLIWSYTVQASEESNIIKIRFADSNGIIISNIEEQILYKNSFVILPDVPGEDGIRGNAVWKLETKIPSETMSFDENSVLKYSTLIDWSEYMVNGYITLYASKICYLNFYNNSGSIHYGRNQIVAYEGTTVKLPGSLDGNTLNKGWSKYKNGSGVWRKLNEDIVVTESLNLYQVYYVKITFREMDGTINSDLRLLGKTVKKGTVITLPALPLKTNYLDLGWSSTKNASSAEYTTGQKITVNSNMTYFAVRKYQACIVKFTNNSGTSKNTAYTKLNTRWVKNTYLELPGVPEVKGYIGLGWTTQKKGKTATYKEGEKVKITKSITFYAVYKKKAKCTVKFLPSNGKVSEEYTKLNKSVLEKDTIILPEIPQKTGYINLGWNITSNGKTYTYKVGAKISVNKNLVFYANQKQRISVVLHNNDGSAYKVVGVGKGTNYTLPSAVNEGDNIFMGWATKANRVVPASGSYYKAGQQIKINKTLHLYKVIFKKSSETDLVSSTMEKVDYTKYKKVIFIGDSRTVRMSSALQVEGCSSNKAGINFIFKSGGGLQWFKESGYGLLKTAVGSGSKEGELPIAVLVNLGVNDLENISTYITYMNRLAEIFSKKGCKMFYMSVNPVNQMQMKDFAQKYSHDLKTRTEAEVLNFNNSLKANLKGYTYIDCHSWLMQNGYSTDNGSSGVNSGQDDGLHYTVKTYKRIFDYCMKIINNR